MNELLEKWESLHSHLEKLATDAEETKKEMSEVVKELSGQVANKTFEWSGKHYSLRRRGKTYYLAVADRPFGSWNKKNA